VSTRKQPTFDVIPAIDLRAGRVVRLQEGDFERETIYADDAVAVAHGFAAAGARWLHIVDLDGARTGERRQAAVISAIRRALLTTVRLQVGGGIRSVEAVASTLADGANRVVLGTSALDNPDLINTAIQRHGPDRVAVALDVRGGRAVGHGWVPGARGEDVDEALARLESQGVRTFVATAIDRDGLLGGPNVALLQRLSGLTRWDVIASGGIASIDDIRVTRAVGCRGAIVGRALYDGRVDLAEALAAD
jgi:phosphoribosylformimino-5-aminoimidazole carboxamide ribotide isomerase